MRKVLFEEQTIDRHMMTFNSSERSYDLWSKVLYLSEVLYLRKRSYIDDAQFTRSILQYVYTHTHSDEISWSYSNSINCTEWYFHVLSLCFSDHLWMVLNSQPYKWMEWDGMECDGRKSINASLLFTTLWTAVLKMRMYGKSLTFVSRINWKKICKFYSRCQKGTLLALHGSHFYARKDSVEHLHFLNPKCFACKPNVQRT